MTLLEDIVDYLVQAGLVQGDGIDVFRDFKPDEPDNIVSLHEYQGDPISPYTNVAHRSVQVVARNKSAAAAQALANNLCDVFRASDDVQRINFTSTRWGQVHVRQAPYKFMQDEKDRTHYVFNLGITTTTD